MQSLEKSGYLASRSPPHMASFKILNKIGQGGYGHVYTVEKMNGTDERSIYAMKVLKKKSVKKSSKDIEYVRSERDVMAKTSSPFIVGLKYAFQSDQKIYLVMEFVPGGELFTRLLEKGVLPVEHAKFYLSEILLALECLHKKDIIYRDLKPDNILIHSSGHIKLADFGLCKFLSNSGRCDSTSCNKLCLCKDKDYPLGTSLKLTRSCCGTLIYMAPEILARKPYGKPADFWSLGVLAYVLMVGSPPFYVDCEESIDNHILRKNPKHRKNFKRDENRAATKYNILHCNYRMPNNLDKSSQSLIRLLLQNHVHDRLGGLSGDPDKVKSHEFFRGLDWSSALGCNLEPPFIPILNGPDDTSRFDQSMISEPNHSGKVIIADFREPNDESDDSGAGSDDSDSTTYIPGFDYLDPGLLMSENFRNLNCNMNAKEKGNSSFKKKLSGAKSLF